MPQNLTKSWDVKSDGCLDGGIGLMEYKQSE